MSRAPVVEGSFGQMSVDDILSVVSLSRQCMELVFEGPRPGTLLVKSGHVLAAHAPPDFHGREAFVSLYRQPGQKFTVYRHDQMPPSFTVIGTLNELVGEARAASVERPASNVILDGSLSEYSLREVLEVVSTSRQVMEVSLFRRDGSQAHLRVKSGMLLAASDPQRGLADLPALSSMLRDPGDRFVVRRLLRPVPQREPLGALSRLLGDEPPPPHREAPSQRTPATLPPREAVPTPAAAPRAGAPSQVPVAPRETTPDALVAEADFASFPLLSVLSTLALTRQTMELVFRDEDGTRGMLVVKAGQVLDVRAAGSTGQEAFNDLMANPGSSFRLLRRTDRPEAKSLGTLASWVAGTRRVVPLPLRQKLLDGAFDEFTMDDLLNVVSTSRQRLSVELQEAERPRGRLMVQSGMLVEASTSDGLVGRDALVALLRAPGDRFVVRRELERAAMPVPVGRLVELVRGVRGSSAPSGASTSMSALLLEGRFDDFSIDDVISVLHLSRQLVELRVYGHGPGPIGVMRFKAGHVVLAARGGTRDPLVVLSSILEEPFVRFEVDRVPEGGVGPSLGRLDVLIDEIRRPFEEKPTVLHLVEAGPTLSPDDIPAADAEPTQALGPPSDEFSDEDPLGPPFDDSPTLVPEAETGRHQRFVEEVSEQGAAVPSPLPELPAAISDQLPIIEDPAAVAEDLIIEAAVDTALDTAHLAEQIEAVRAEITDRSLEIQVSDLVQLVQKLQKRVEDQDRQIRTTQREPGVGIDVWLTLLGLFVQAMTVLAILALALAGWVGGG